MNDIPEAGEFLKEYDKWTATPERDREYLFDIFTRHATAFLRRVLGEMKKDYCESPISTINRFIDRYSPKPRYCEGMREAINAGDIVKMDNGYYFNFRGARQYLNRCPFCPDGDNCIGDNNGTKEK